MAIVEVNWRPDWKQLRGFGVISLVAFGAIGAWLYFRHSFLGFEIGSQNAERAAYVLWGLAAICAVLALVAPRALRPLYLGLTLASLPIGYVVSHIIMALLFYGVFTPIGLILRLAGKDFLQRDIDTAAGTYWVPRPPVTDRKRYYRQF